MSPIHIPGSWKISALTYFYSCSKTPDVCQRCLSITLQGKLDSQLALNGSSVTARAVPVQRKPRCLLKAPLLYYHAKKSDQSACTFLGTLSALCKGAWGTVMPWLLMETSALSLSFWWCTCLSPLRNHHPPLPPPTTPQLSSLQGEDSYRAWAFPSSSLISE